MKTTISGIINSFSDILSNIDSDPEFIVATIEELRILDYKLSKFIHGDANQALKPINNADLKKDLMDIHDSLVESIDISISDDFMPIKRMNELLSNLKKIKQKYGLI